MSAALVYGVWIESNRRQATIALLRVTCADAGEAGRLADAVKATRVKGIRGRDTYVEVTEWCANAEDVAQSTGRVELDCSGLLDVLDGLAPLASELQGEEPEAAEAKGDTGEEAVQ